MQKVSKNVDFDLYEFDFKMKRVEITVDTISS